MTNNNVRHRFQTLRVNTAITHSMWINLNLWTAGKACDRSLTRAVSEPLRNEYHVQSTNESMGLLYCLLFIAGMADHGQAVISINTKPKMQ